MLLRKHLLGAEILSVSQHEFERIVEIRLRCTGDFSRCERVLVCEIMGKYSNLVLTENGTILGALKTTSLEDNAKRVLLSGAKYAYPLPQDKLSPFDAEGLKERIQSFLSTHTDGDGRNTPAFFSTTLRESLCPPRASCSAAFPGVRRLGVRRRFLPQSARRGLPPHLGRNPRAAKRRTFSPSPSKTAYPCPPSTPPEDEYYYRRETKRAFEDKKRRLEAAVRSLHKKQQKKLQDTLERLKECERMETLRVKGELLTANLYRLERGMKETELENWYDADPGALCASPWTPASPPPRTRRNISRHTPNKSGRKRRSPPGCGRRKKKCAIRTASPPPSPSPKRRTI